MWTSLADLRFRKDSRSLFFTSLSVCLSVCLPVCLSVCLSVCLFVCFSVCFSVSGLCPCLCLRCVSLYRSCMNVFGAIRTRSSASYKSNPELLHRLDWNMLAIALWKPLLVDREPSTQRRSGSGLHGRCAPCGQGSAAGSTEHLVLVGQFGERRRRKQ